MVVEIDFWLVTKVPASQCIKLKHEKIFFRAWLVDLKHNKTKNPKASVIAGVKL